MARYKVYVFIEANNRKEAREKFQKKFFERDDWEHPDHLANQFFVEETPPKGD